MRKMKIKEVCEYLGIGHTSFYNYKSQGMPVHKMPAGKPYCYKEEVDKWLETKNDRRKKG